MNTRRAAIDLARTEQAIIRLRRKAQERFGYRCEKLCPPAWQAEMLELKNRAKDLRRQMERAA